MTPSSPQVYLKIPVDKLFLGIVRNVIVDLAERHGFDPPEISKIEMAIDEACANVIEHAYMSGELSTGLNDDNIEISISMHKNQFFVELLDAGNRQRRPHFLGTAALLGESLQGSPQKST